MTRATKLPRGISERRDADGKLIGYRVRRAHRREVRAATYELAVIEWQKMYRDNARAISENRTLTFGAYLKANLNERLDAGEIGTTSHATYSYLAETHIQRLGREMGPHPLWHTKLVAVNRELVKDLLETLTPVSGSGQLSGSSIGTLRSLITSVMQGAIEAGLVQSTENPARRVKIPSKTVAKRVPLDGHEMNLLRAHTELTGERLHALYVLSLTTGLRQGEALGLRWQDIGDLDAGSCELIVRGQLNRRQRAWTDKTKTAGSRRTIHLGATAKLALKVWRGIQAAERERIGAKAWADRNPDDLVFTRRDGRPMSAMSLGFHLERMLRESGAGASRMRREPTAGKLSWHDLRHSWATLMLAEGYLTMYEVSYLLGHRSIKTTIDTYGHLTDTSRAKAADAIEAALAASATDAVIAGSASHSMLPELKEIR